MGIHRCGCCRKSGGLLTGWKSDSLQLTNSWAMQNVLGTLFFSPSHNLPFLFLNIYGPYANRKVFWDKLLPSPLLSFENIILGGDLNLTLGACEIWGSIAQADPLYEYFIKTLEDHKLFDPTPPKLSPTWRNM
jgi:hypothetical protein